MTKDKKAYCRERAAAAVKAGTIKKSYRCEHCEKIFRNIEGHHFNYSKPLNITWLCPVCHRAIHHLNPHLKGLWTDRRPGLSPT
jgi:rubredoxin